MECSNNPVSHSLCSFCFQNVSSQIKCLISGAVKLLKIMLSSQHWDLFVYVNVTCDPLLTRPKTFVLPRPDSEVTGVGCHQTFTLVFVSLECIPHIFSPGLEMKLVICGGNRAWPSFQSLLKENWLTSLTYWLSPFSPTLTTQEDTVYEGVSLVLFHWKIQQEDNKPPPLVFLSSSCFYVNALHVKRLWNYLHFSYLHMKNNLALWDKMQW